MPRKGEGHTVFQAVEFPAGIPDLDSGLADVDGDHLTLEGKIISTVEEVGAAAGNNWNLIRRRKGNCTWVAG